MVNVCSLLFCLQGMEALKASGKVKSIGVSNFNILQLERLLTMCTVPPAVIQVLHIYYCSFTAISGRKSDSRTLSVLTQISSQISTIMTPGIGSHSDVIQLHMASYDNNWISHYCNSKESFYVIMVMQVMLLFPWSFGKKWTISVPVLVCGRWSYIPTWYRPI